MPLVINTFEQISRELLLLSGEEREVARKIVEIIKKNNFKRNFLLKSKSTAIKLLTAINRGQAKADTEIH